MMNRFSTRPWVLLAALLSVHPGLRSAPVAVPDSGYSVEEDGVLTAAGVSLLNASFNSPAVVPFGPTWKVLTGLTNGSNSTAVLSYPVDGSGTDWKLANFNPATSTPGGAWVDATAPMVGPASTSIDFYNTASPSVVFPGGPNRTTYLLRNTLEVTAEQASTATWSIRYLVDDGCVVHINGTRAFALNMPAGTIATTTFASSSGEEGQLTTAQINLAGLLVPGVNTIAIELHQAVSLSDAGFFMEWTPAVDTAGGFAYADGAFGSVNRPDLESGSNLITDGNNGTGGLHVRCGPGVLFSNTGLLTGGWSRTFTVPSAGSYTVSMGFRLATPGSGTFERQEYQLALLEIDSTRLGTSYPAAANGVPAAVALFRHIGRSGIFDSGWVAFNQTLSLGAGVHTIKFGAFVNDSTAADEYADAYFDDVVISSAGGSGYPSVLANDTGTPPLTAVKDTDPAHGALVFNNDGSFVYTPTPGYSGPDSFTYHAVDGTGSSVPVVVGITVIASNDAPEAVADAYSTPEDVPLTVAAPGVMGNDLDADGDPLTAVVRATPANGTLALGANGGFTYTPNANFHGTDSFTYRVNDGQVNSADQTVVLTVQPINDAPVVVADTYRTSRNMPLDVSLSVATNQTPETVLLVAPGLTVPLGDPAETNLPVWKYLDDGSNQGTAWRAPEFNDAAWSTGLAELGYGDAPDGRPERTLIGYGPNANARYATTYFRTTFQVQDKSTHSNLRLRLLRDDAAILYLNGVEIYRDITLPSNPASTTYATAAVSGADEIVLVDVTSALVSGAINNLVEGLNVLAVEVHQSAATSSDVSFDLELTAEKLPFAGVLANDSDIEGAALLATLVDEPSNGEVVLNGDGTFLYTPDNGFFGDDTFTYAASDGTLSTTGTVTVVVDSGLNSPPTAAGDDYSTVQEDTPFTVAAPGVLGNDSDPDLDPLSAILVSSVAHGSLALAANGGFTFTPAADYSGPDGFSYRARDARGRDSGTVQVNLTVVPVNDPPVGVPDAYGGDPGVPLVVSAIQGVLGNDTDVDGASLSAVLVSPPAQGSLSLAAGGSFTFTPPPGFSGTATFTYRVNDGTLNSAPTLVTLSINGRPLAADDLYAVVEDGALMVSAPQGVLGNDSDPESSPISVALVNAPTSGSLSLSADGGFTYTPARNYFGADAFAYTASDGVRVSALATVTLQVQPRNDPPAASADEFQALPGSMTSFPAPGVLGNDTDPDGDALVAELVEAPANGMLNLAADGSFTYTPLPGFSGEDGFAYRARDGSLFSAATEVTLRVDTPGEELVITEIMYRAGITYPEVTALEFFELHNRGGVAVDLAGWTVGAGVSYAFPPGRSVPPGGYLVVAANVAAFQAANPGVTNVVGGWTGTLSNSGETLRLVDAQGRARDEVQYASEGDWAQRVRETTFNGWAWTTLADGGGRSMELLNAALDNKCGQNWAPSPTTGGSPGRANDAGTPDIAPMIRKVEHSPAVPTSSDPVVISCELTDETGDEGLSASLVWRDATSTTPGPVSTTPMSRDGTGRWFAVLPPMANQTIVEFYVSATDGVNARAWPAPTALGQVANCQYQVSNEAGPPTTEIVRMVLTAAENAAYNAAATSSDRQFNHTLVVSRGGESEIRYLCDMRARGNSSRTYTIGSLKACPMRVSIPADSPLDDLTTFMLNPKASFLQYLGMRLFQASGLRAPDAVPVELRRNGIELTTSSGSTPDFGRWVRMEDIGGDFVKEHWPLADDGNVYKKGRNDFFWRATQPAPANPDSLLDGWSKQNNSALNDWSDLRSFFSVWQAAAAPHFPASNPLDVAGSGGNTITNIGNWVGTAFTSNQVASVRTVSDLEQWARWFAVMTILQDNETNISNGQDDDYAVYFQPTVVGPATNRLMQLLPHDLDTIFGLGDSTLSYNSRGLYDMTDNTYIFRTLLPLLGNNTTAGNPAFRALYHGALRELLGTVFDTTTTVSTPSPFNRMVDQHIGGWASATAVTTIKNFANLRRTYLLGLLGTNAIPPAVGTSIETWESPAAPTLLLHEVLANNLSAHANGGLFPDVVEILNHGAATVDLAGMSLTDDPLVKDRFIFPASTLLEPGALLTLYADTATLAPGLHLGFALSASGDGLYLYDSVTAGQGLLDSVSFGLQPPDFSIGRTGPGLTTWALCAPSIGATNTQVAALGPAAGVRINEWLGNADFRVDDDFIELLNPSLLPVALGGMGLTDDPVNRPFRGLIPPLSFMAPTAYLVFEPKGDKAAPGDASELPYNLGSTSGAVALFGANGALVDRGDTITQFRDVSTGRLPDGEGPFVRLSPPTPGQSNNPLPDGESDLLASLRITEMMYHPVLGTDAEYIELRNISDQGSSPVTLDLGGVRFTRGITFTFPTNSLLAAGASLVLTHDPLRFAAQYPAVTPAGTFAGRLSDGGERITLELPSAALAIHDFTYNDAWHPTTDGAGAALQIVDPLGEPARWDVAEGWQATTANPGERPSFGVDAGPDRTWALGPAMPLDGSVYYGTQTAAAVTVAWSQDSGPAAGTWTTANHPDSSIDFPSPGLYTLNLSATAPGPVTVSDTVSVLVHDTYATWAARLLDGQPTGRQGMLDDADFDGAGNLAEFVLGSDPLNPASRPRIQFLDDGGLYKVTWQRNRFADPSIQVVAQICRGPNLDLWEDSPASILSWQTGQDDTFQQWQAVDQTAPGPGLQRYFRLQIVSP